MKQLSLLFFSLILLTWSCSKDDTVNPKPISANAVNFSNLQAGQQSFYKMYTTKCDSLDEEFAFTGDTLVLEVVEGEASLQLREYFTEKSPRYLSGANTETIEYPVKSEGTNAILPQRENSFLFFFYANDTLRLQPEQRVDLVQQDCKLHLEGNPFIGNDIGNVATFTIGDITVRDKISASCEPFFDLDAYLIYDENQLSMSHVIHEEYFWDDLISTRIQGWVLIE